jgi:hypothetical protein
MRGTNHGYDEDFWDDDAERRRLSIDDRNMDYHRK